MRYVLGAFLIFLVALGFAQPYSQAWAFDSGTPVMTRMAVDASGQAYAAGFDADNLVVIKINASGGEVWRKTFPGYPSMVIKRVAVDHLGTVYVGLIAGNPNKQFNVVALSGATGAFKWASVVDSADTSSDGDIAVGRSGGSAMVYVLHTYGTTPDTQVLAYRLNTSTGGIMWLQLFDNDGGNDTAVKVVTNTTGSPFIAMTLSKQGKPFANFRRLSGTDGSVVWNFSVASTGSTGGAAVDLAVLSNGNVGFSAQKSNSGGVRSAVNGSLAGSTGAEVNTVTTVTDSAGAATRTVAPDAYGGFRYSAVQQAGDQYYRYSANGLVRPSYSAAAPATSVGDSRGQVHAAYATPSKNVTRLGDNDSIGIAVTPSQLVVDSQDNVYYVGWKSVVKLNQRPVALNDTYVRPSGSGHIMVEAPGVLENDQGSFGGTLAVETPPANGSVTLNQDGSFDYTKGGGFTGTDTFTYRLTQGSFSSVGTVTVTELTVVSHVTDGSVIGGMNANGTVTFNTTPDAVLRVGISDNSSAVVSPSGDAPLVVDGSNQFHYTVGTLAVSSTINATMTVTVGPLITTAPLTLTKGGLKTFAAFKTNIVSGEKTNGTVTISGAVANDRVVTLSSNNNNVTMPATVTIPAGSTSVTFLISTKKTTNNQFATLKAKLDDTTKSLSFESSSMPTIDSIDSFSDLAGGENRSLIVTFNKTVDYTLSISCVVTPSSASAHIDSFSLAPLDINHNTIIHTVPVTVTVNATAKFSFAPRTVTKTFQILPNPLESVSVASSTVVGGSPTTGTVTLRTAAPPAGLVVSLSAGPQVSVPSSVTVSAGVFARDFTVSTSPVTVQGTRTITATLGPVAKTTTLTLTP